MLSSVKPLSDYSIDEVCTLWTAVLPKVSSSVVEENGINGEMLVTLSDEEMADILKLNKLQIRALRTAMSKTKQ